MRGQTVAVSQKHGGGEWSGRGRASPPMPKGARPSPACVAALLPNGSLRSAHSSHHSASSVQSPGSTLDRQPQPKQLRAVHVEPRCARKLNGSDARCYSQTSRREKREAEQGKDATTDTAKRRQESTEESRGKSRKEKREKERKRERGRREEEREETEPKQAELNRRQNPSQREMQRGWQPRKPMAG